jgi:hypothetical protein
MACGLFFLGALDQQSKKGPPEAQRHWKAQISHLQDLLEDVDPAAMERFQRGFQ